MSFTYSSPGAKTCSGGCAVRHGLGLIYISNTTTRRSQSCPRDDTRGVQSRRRGLRKEALARKSHLPIAAGERDANFALMGCITFAREWSWRPRKNAVPFHPFPFLVNLLFIVKDELSEICKFAIEQIWYNHVGSG